MVNRRHTIAHIALSVGLVVGSAVAHAQTPSQTPPDNTKTNTRDRAATAKTADQQSNSKADLDLTQKIRSAIVADKALSTYAHNVKVITRDGHVTLKGPVQTVEEKTAIAAKAAEIAGTGKVTNQTSVMSPSKKTRTSSGKDK
jgi:hyperosmotically inducible periplasmic protein